MKPSPGVVCDNIMLVVEISMESNLPVRHRDSLLCDWNYISSLARSLNGYTQTYVMVIIVYDKKVRLVI